MNDIAIQVENLSKSYRIGSTPNGNVYADYQSLRDVVTTAMRLPLQRVQRWWGGQVPRTQPVNLLWALKALSFEVRRGEVIGIIGRNGAGKSTLLKILARITEPTAGEATIYGRVGSLLEVGTGFHPELTGRENVFLNGAILGMNRAEILRKFDEIVAFAEIEPFLDTPVKHYSSGMYMRLAFAVAAHLEPEILLVDEVLAVGDAQFQKKCLGKMGHIAHEGRTVFFVSHNMTAISALCQRVLYLKDGQLQTDAGSETAILQYMADGEERVQTPLAQRADRTGSGDVYVTGIRCLDAKTHIPLTTVASGQAVYLEVSYAAAPTYRKPINDLMINLDFRTHLDHYILSFNSRMANRAFQEQLPATGQLYCYVERFPLMPGHFWGTSTLHISGIIADRLLHAFTFDVEEGDFFGTGIAYHWNQHSVYVPHHWLRELP